MNRFNKEVKNRSRHVETSVPKMKRDIYLDSMPIKVGEDEYMVHQNFHYIRPRRYKIEFARPAIFDKGCLTCGHENVKVENYGERHCCNTCLNSLKTPAGDLVTLKATENGRFIIGTAWQWSKPTSQKVNIDDLRIRGGHKCHATFAGEKGDVIVLLDEINEFFIYD